MIGLEYVLHLYEMQHQELSEKLGIAKQNINRWIKGTRPIPKKYLPVISKIFNIPDDIFQKQLNEEDKIEIQKLKIKNDIKNKKEIPELDLKKITLKKMVDMLNEVARSEYGGITIETKGVIEIPTVTYARSSENDWGVFIQKKVKNDIIYERCIIRDDNMIVEDFIFDTIEIVGGVTYDKYMNQFSFYFDINLEVIITVYDYEFKYNDIGKLHEEEKDK
ncbi:DNA-binding protein [Clostridium carboxidivorans P7]|uniref:DNA-binding protein n=1 Tax=Clostridium carboxidivorans P7 TaxID=536227 RepID=C6PT20_9CLOT|nr:helix-turn-helix domain-containing protein [Clostridium carboxidivorans]EET87655.1 DNA-binding protein [Clostridium carboxidivorans P7]